MLRASASPFVRTMSLVPVPPVKAISSPAAKVIPPLAEISPLKAAVVPATVPPTIDVPVTVVPVIAALLLITPKLVPMEPAFSAPTVVICP